MLYAMSHQMLQDRSEVKQSDAELETCRQTDCSPGKASPCRLLAFPPPLETGRMPRQRLAVIAVDLALLLRRQLRKPHLTGMFSHLLKVKVITCQDERKGFSAGIMVHAGNCFYRLKAGTNG
ncbi:hypothetical protein NQZ68_014496 [Dissostichus eleginoides]|nr:hypothetical protein NQZ68_037978 [Dissostichus eleginoides]KAI9524960.1 hypothetical protein NQZ68_014496 [Dissostichus eleginoides]